jgi:hypothetical protein
MQPNLYCQSCYRQLSQLKLNSLCYREQSHQEWLPQFKTQPPPLELPIVPHLVVPHMELPTVLQFESPKEAWNDYSSIGSRYVPPG